MAENIKTFKDIDKNLKALVEVIKSKHKKEEQQANVSTKLLTDVNELVENIEQGRGPTTKIQKEMLRVLEVSEAQDKVRARDQASAEYKAGQETLEQLKKLNVSRQDYIKAGFGQVDSTIESMRQWWQESVGKFREGIKLWWENTKKNSIIWQAGIKIWNSETAKNLKAIGSQISSFIGQHLREVLGEFSEVFDLFKKTIGTIYNAVKNVFLGAFDLVKERKKEWREKRMENHLRKIRDGIGRLVRKDKVGDISKKTGKKGPGMMASVLDFLGLGKLIGMGGVAGAGLLAGLGALLLKAGIITALSTMLIGALKNAIKAWKNGKDAEEIQKAFLGGLTKLPRMVLGWLFKQFEWDAGAKAMTDESFNNFIDKMNDYIQNLIETIDTWFKDAFIRIEAFGRKQYNKWIASWVPFADKMAESDPETVKSDMNKFDKKLDQIQANPAPTGGTKANFTDRINELAAERARIKEGVNLSGITVEHIEILKSQLKKTDETIELLKEQRDLAKEKFSHSTMMGGRGSAFIPVPGDAGIKKYPDTDSQLNRDNRNWGAYSGMSDKRLKTNIRGL